MPGEIVSNLEIGLLVACLVDEFHKNENKMVGINGCLWHLFSFGVETFDSSWCVKFETSSRPVLIWGMNVSESWVSVPEVYPTWPYTRPTLFPVGFECIECVFLEPKQSWQLNFLIRYMSRLILGRHLLSQQLLALDPRNGFIKLAGFRSPL